MNALLANFPLQSAGNATRVWVRISVMRGLGGGSPTGWKAIPSRINHIRLLRKTGIWTESGWGRVFKNANWEFRIL
jgi:hypothetical protein